MSKMPKYFMYFPGNYRWSAAFVTMLGRGAYGAAEIGELHKIGRLLEGKAPDDDEAWFNACVRVADEVRGHAERFRASPREAGGARLGVQNASLAGGFIAECNTTWHGRRRRTSS